MIRPLLAAALCLPLLVPVASAQDETPEVVVGQLMAAMKANDWGRATGLMHPVALRQLRVLLDPILTAEGATLDTARQMLFGFDQQADATTASDSALMFRLMRFAMSQSPKVPESLRSSTYRLLGVVREGPDTAHVVGRVSMTFAGSTVSQIEVSSLMRAGSTWRLMLKGDYSEMAKRLRAALLQNQ